MIIDYIAVFEMASQQESVRNFTSCPMKPINWDWGPDSKLHSGGDPSLLPVSGFYYTQEWLQWFMNVLKISY